ncbi:MAG: nitronate monooxygenase family protein [Bacteroidia bacterium]
MQTELTKLTGIKYPIIMAPMFLVSNVAMMKAGLEAGVLSMFPTLNFRQEDELENVIDILQQFKKEHAITDADFGVNLIVQKTNPLYERHLRICVEKKVMVFITSLGSPRVVIEEAHKYGGKVFCDVINMEHAKKVYDLNCDGFIAVGQGAGGHAGPYPLSILVPSLKKNFPDKPVIAAGGIANGHSICSMLAVGAAGVSIGTRFIASKEAGISDEYKNAVVNSHMSDIVLTERISGTPCTIINTPYAKRIGYKQNFFEKMMSKNNTTKKYFKMLVQLRGMKRLEAAIKPGNYDNLWCAGQSVELIDDIQSCKHIIDQLVEETKEAFEELSLKMSYI